MLKENMVFSLKKIVSPSETAAQVASGALEVFSTPMLIAFMENTAFKLVEPFLSSGESTVGTAVNIKHLKANLIGDELLCTATLKKITDKRLDFFVQVFFGDKIVGEGEHSRYIINTAQFLEKLKR